MQNPNIPNKYTIPTTTGGTLWPPALGTASSPYSFPILTDLQQCIRDCLRLATFAHLNPAGHPWELDRLQKLIEAQVQKELDAWKMIMGGESKSGTICDAAWQPGPIEQPGPIGQPGSVWNPGSVGDKANHGF